MREPIISYAQAQDLNLRVQSKLSPHLFACCNYEPTPLRTLSEDGWFGIAIQDLYKFVIDASPVIDNFWFYLPRNKRGKYPNFRTSLNQIKMLRAAIDHNQSAEDGFSARENRIAFQNWVVSVIGRPEIASIADYALLNQDLEQLAHNLLSDIQSMIDEFGSALDKSQITGQWLKDTLYWYSHNTKTQYYYNQIADAYIARAYSVGHFYISALPERDMKRRINHWIYAAFCKPFEDRIAECNSKINTNTNILDGSSAMSHALMGKLPKDALARMKENLANEIRQAQAERDAQEELLKDMQEKLWKDRNRPMGSRPSEYLYSCMEKRVTDLMSSLDAANETYTLLPQDILQRDVTNLFDGVPSPENDF